MLSARDRDLKNIRDVSLTELRKYVDTCHENTPAKAVYTMIRLVLAYKADTKFSKDPLFKETEILLKKFSDNYCACNKIGLRQKVDNKI